MNYDNLPAIIRFLYRSGAGGSRRDDNNDTTGAGGSGAGGRRTRARPTPPANRGLRDHELGAHIQYRIGFTDPPHPRSALQHLRYKRSNLYSSIIDGGYHGAGSHRRHDRALSSSFVPNWQQCVNHYHSRAFCGQFSRDGQCYVITTQDDQMLHLYDSARIGDGNNEPFKEIQARRVSWSIIDTDYSPNNHFVIYSTWSPYVQLCNVYGDYELHEPLHMEPANASRVCFFSVKFSPDNRQILGGCSDYHLYLFDIERKQRKLCVGGHTDDINTVAFADASGDVMLTGSDDRTIRIWDQRILSSTVSDSRTTTNAATNNDNDEDHDNVPFTRRGIPARSQYGRPVGSFLGHSEGITHIESAGDGRLFCSNGKDQCIKLWDIRAMKSASDAESVVNESQSDYDYRYGLYGGNASHADTWTMRHDCSIGTMRGHRVFETLVRCHFSPAFTTGQRFIYTGSYDGDVLVYDTLTGEVVSRLNGHRATVRDCSWHPYESYMLTVSWDHTASIWSFASKSKDGDDNEAKEEKTQHSGRGPVEEDEEEEEEDADGELDDKDGEEEEEDDDDDEKRDNEDEAEDGENVMEIEVDGDGVNEDDLMEIIRHAMTSHAEHMANDSTATVASRTRGSTRGRPVVHAELVSDDDADDGDANVEAREYVEL